MSERHMLNIGVKGRKKQLYTKMKHTLDHFIHPFEGTFSKRYSFNPEIYLSAFSQYKKD